MKCNQRKIWATRAYTAAIDAFSVDIRLKASERDECLVQPLFHSEPL
jgi:hypothetical protein